MKAKILELLKTKFVGVSDQTLSRMAEKAAKTATTDDEAQTYVDGVTYQLVIDSEADYRATKAVQTSIENYEKKHNIKDGKPVSQEPPKTDPPKEKADEVPEWAKAVLEFVNQTKESQKQEKLKSVKNSLVEKLIEKGANKDDRKHIESLIEIAGVSEEDDIDAKSDVILGVYNNFKKPSKTLSPGKTDDEIADDEFDKLLEVVK